jgi:signal transduction histidine kinase
MDIKEPDFRVASTPAPRAHGAPAAGPSLLASVLIAAALVAVTGVLRFAVLPGRVLPVAYGVPLVACVYLRRRSILWAMVLAFTAMSAAKFAIDWRSAAEYSGSQHWLAWAMVQADILAVAAFVHYVIGARQTVEGRAAELLRLTQELATREEEAVAQNHELQAQGEELTAQAQELERQGEELRLANAELEARERMLEHLLDLSQSLTADLSRRQVAERIARGIEGLVAVPGSAAVAVLERRERRFEVVASHGLDGVDGDGIDGDHSMAAAVLERGQTTYVPDVSTRPELRLPPLASGAAPGSILAAPLRLAGGRAGTLEVYTARPFEWGPRHVAIVEALAAQASISLANAALVEELDRRRTDAEEAALRKARFLAAVSHDIRTPANAINLMAELLVTLTTGDGLPRAAHDGDGQQDEVATVARELRDGALSLMQLVSDVLDVTRYEFGRVELKVSEFPLDKLIEDQLRQHREVATAKGLALTASGSGGVIVRADYVKLGRVLSNLLGNAVKFTSSGSVELCTEVLADGRLSLAVRDTGPGIAREHQLLIFDEFYQVRNPARDRLNGTGLGLAICKRLVDAMRGTLEVLSDEGAGSTFTVTLPAGSVVSPTADLKSGI